MATKSYELIADHYHEVTSKPNEALTYKSYVKGDKIKLEDGRAQELIDAGAIKDPNAKDSDKPGQQPKAPNGGDALDEGAQTPTGTGATGTGAPAGVAAPTTGQGNTPTSGTGATS